MSPEKQKKAILTCQIDSTIICKKLIVAAIYRNSTAVNLSWFNKMLHSHGNLLWLLSKSSHSYIIHLQFNPSLYEKRIIMLDLKLQTLSWSSIDKELCSGSTIHDFVFTAYSLAASTTEAISAIPLINIKRSPRSIGAY